MRHVAPVVNSIIIVWGFGRVVNKPVHTSCSRHRVQIIDLILARSIPFGIDFCRPCTAKWHAAAQKEAKGRSDRGTKRRSHDKVLPSCGLVLLRLRRTIPRDVCKLSEWLFNQRRRGRRVRMAGNIGPRTRANESIHEALFLPRVLGSTAMAGVNQSLRPGGWLAATLSGEAVSLDWSTIAARGLWS